ncbi:borderless isoform X2 [Arctopsyche grandis]|uniref:borderless isoform X2 n=1 Tax=Arctopsyche grandis TaxID=121162 RepID=UPI00406D7BA6
MTMFRVGWTICFLWGSGLTLSLDRPRNIPTKLSAAVGDSVVFNCPLDFPQDIEIPYILNWKKDGRLIFSWHNGEEQPYDEFSDRIVRLENDQRNFGRGSINITAIRETDSGWYECKVIFPNRTPISRNNGTWFHLTIDGPILISIPPVNQTTMEKETALFPCIIKEANASVIWYKDGIPISNISDLAQRSWLNQNGSLTIKPTIMGDLGEYTCEVINSTGFTQTASAYLDVQYKAKVIYTPREIYLPYGRPSILDCHFRANPALTSLHWLKDGFLYHPFNVPGVYSKPNGSLYFEKVDENHAGKYSCTPTNKLGTDGPSPIINVIVQRPPAFITTPKSIYLRKLGDSIEMPCEALNTEGQYRPTINWSKKDGSLLPEGRYVLQGGNLTLSSLKEEDRGMYQCSASNEAATVTTETELMIENVPPRAPYNLVASSTSDSVTLRWAPASSMPTFTNPTEWSTFIRPHTEYSVWFKPVEAEEWRTMRTSSSRITEATIGNLQPGREYEFMVLSQDKFSDGMFSKSIKVWTQGSDEIITKIEREPLEAIAQIGPPRNLTVALTADGYLLSWSPPNHGLDMLRVYVVRWSQGALGQIVNTAETTNNYYLIQDLEEDEIYHFEVDSLSIHDYKITSEKISVHVPAYGRIRAAVAGVGCILLLILIGAVVWYSRHKLMGRTTSESQNKKKSNGDN